jgi:hypothetical protein
VGLNEFFEVAVSGLQNLTIEIMAEERRRVAAEEIARRLVLRNIFGREEV